MSSMFNEWVIDATMGMRGGLFCFCPVDGDLRGEFSIVTGMNFLSLTPPGKVVAVIHEGGQDAVDAFCAEFKTELDDLAKRASDGFGP